MAVRAAGRLRPIEGRAAPGGEPEIPADPGVLLSRFQRLLESQSRSPWTVKQYLHIARRFLAYVGRPLDEVSARDLERYREYLVLERRYSKNSLYTTLRGLSCLFRSFGLAVAEGVPVPRRPERLPRYLTAEEMRRLLAAVAEDPRDRALVAILAYTGLRVGELCRLDVDDADCDAGLLHVRSGKGDKDREVILEERAQEALRPWLRERSRLLTGSPRLFGLSPSSVERRLRHWAERAGIERKVTPHMLRHTLATTLLSGGCDIRYIQKLLGHSSVATTQIYTHVDTQSLRAAYERARPPY